MSHLPSPPPSSAPSSSSLTRDLLYERLLSDHFDHQRAEAEAAAVVTHARRREHSLTAAEREHASVFGGVGVIAPVPPVPHPNASPIVLRVRAPSSTSSPSRSSPHRRRHHHSSPTRTLTVTPAHNSHSADGSRTVPFFMEVLLHPRTHPTLEAIKTSALSKQLEQEQIELAAGVYGPPYLQSESGGTVLAPWLHSSHPSPASSLPPHELHRVRHVLFTHPTIQKRVEVLWWISHTNGKGTGTKREGEEEQRMSFEEFKEVCERLHKRVYGKITPPPPPPSSSSPSPTTSIPSPSPSLARLCEEEWMVAWGGSFPAYPGASTEFSRVQTLQKQQFLRWVFEWVDRAVGEAGRMVKVSASSSSSSPSPRATDDSSASAPAPSVAISSTILSVPLGPNRVRMPIPHVDLYVGMLDKLLAEVSERKKKKERKGQGQGERTSSTSPSRALTSEDSLRSSTVPSPSPDVSSPPSVVYKFRFRDVRRVSRGSGVVEFIVNTEEAARSAYQTYMSSAIQSMEAHQRGAVDEAAAERGMKRGSKSQHLRSQSDLLPRQKAEVASSSTVSATMGEVSAVVSVSSSDASIPDAAESQQSSLAMPSPPRSISSAPSSSFSPKRHSAPAIPSSHLLRGLTAEFLLHPGEVASGWDAPEDEEDADPNGLFGNAPNAERSTSRGKKRTNAPSPPPPPQPSSRPQTIHIPVARPSTRRGKRESAETPPSSTSPAAAVPAPPLSLLTIPPKELGGGLTVLSPVLEEKSPRLPSSSASSSTSSPVIEGEEPSSGRRGVTQPSELSQPIQPPSPHSPTQPAQASTRTRAYPSARPATQPYVDSDADSDEEEEEKEGDKKDFASEMIALIQQSRAQAMEPVTPRSPLSAGPSPAIPSSSSSPSPRRAQVHYRLLDVPGLPLSAPPVGTTLSGSNHVRLEEKEEELLKESEADSLTVNKGSHSPGRGGKGSPSANNNRSLPSQLASFESMSPPLEPNPSSSPSPLPPSLPLSLSSLSLSSPRKTSSFALPSRHKGWNQRWLPRESLQLLASPSKIEMEMKEEGSGEEKEQDTEKESERQTAEGDLPLPRPHLQVSPRPLRIDSSPAPPSPPRSSSSALSFSKDSVHLTPSSLRSGQPSAFTFTPIPPLPLKQLRSSPLESNRPRTMQSLSHSAREAGAASPLRPTQRSLLSRSQTVFSARPSTSGGVHFTSTLSHTTPLPSPHSPTSSQTDRPGATPRGLKKHPSHSSRHTRLSSSLHNPALSALLHHLSPDRPRSLSPPRRLSTMGNAGCTTDWNDLNADLQAASPTPFPFLPDVSTSSATVHRDTELLKQLQLDLLMSRHGQGSSRPTVLVSRSQAFDPQGSEARLLKTTAHLTLEQQARLEQRIGWGAAKRFEQRATHLVQAFQAEEEEYRKWARREQKKREAILRGEIEPIRPSTQERQWLKQEQEPEQKERDEVESAREQPQLFVNDAAEAFLGHASATDPSSAQQQEQSASSTGPTHLPLPSPRRSSARSPGHTRRTSHTLKPSEAYAPVPPAATPKKLLPFPSSAVQSTAPSPPAHVRSTPRSTPRRATASTRATHAPSNKISHPSPPSSSTAATSSTPRSKRQSDPASVASSSPSPTPTPAPRRRASHRRGGSIGAWSSGGSSRRETPLSPVGLLDPQRIHSKETKKSGETKRKEGTDSDKEKKQKTTAKPVEQNTSSTVPDMLPSSIPAVQPPSPPPPAASPSPLPPLPPLPPPSPSSATLPLLSPLTPTAALSSSPSPSPPSSSHSHSRRPSSLKGSRRSSGRQWSNLSVSFAADWKLEEES